MKTKAFFFDRDGTLIIDKHYQSNPNEIEYLDHYFELIELLQKKEYKLFIITNQSGVARGYFPVSKIIECHEKMNSDLLAKNLKGFEQLAFCPHAPEDNCPCRKPKNILIEEIIKKWNIDVENSYMMGDKESDVLAGKNSNLKSCFIGQEKLESADYNFKNLKELISYINSF